MCTIIGVEGMVDAMMEAQKEAAGPSGRVLLFAESLGKAEGVKSIQSRDLRGNLMLDGAQFALSFSLIKTSVRKVRWFKLEDLEKLWRHIEFQLRFCLSFCFSFIDVGEEFEIENVLTSCEQIFWNIFLTISEWSSSLS